MKMEDCIFCKIINKEIPSNIIFEDEDTIAFYDVNPQAPIHILVLPKKHIKSLNELTEEDYILIKKIYKTINFVANKLDFAQDGFRVITNCGENAGQTVGHLHFHILAGEKLGEKII